MSEIAKARQELAVAQKEMETTFAALARWQSALVACEGEIAGLDLRAEDLDAQRVAELLSRQTALVHIVERLTARHAEDSRHYEAALKQKQIKGLRAASIQSALANWNWGGNPEDQLRAARLSEELALLQEVPGQAENE